MCNTRTTIEQIKAPIAIVGAGGFGREVLWLLSQIGAAGRVEGFFDDREDWQGTLIANTPVVGSINDLVNWPTPLAVVFAVGQPAMRRRLHETIQINQNLVFPSLVHPGVELGDRVSLGEGSILCGGTILTVDIEIGRFCIVNLNCTVGHDVVMGDYCTLSPNVNLSGEVHLGEGCFLGTNAVVIPSRKIGAHAVVGAGSVVVKDVVPDVTVVGVPARLKPQKEK